MNNSPERRRPALILLPNLCLGGSERKSIRVCNALAADGYPIHLGWFGEPDTLLPEIEGGVRVVHLERRGKFSLHALRLLIDHLIEHDVGSVLGVNFYPLPYMALAGFRLRSRGIRWLASINTTSFLKGRDGKFMVVNAPILRRMDRVIFGNGGQRDEWINHYRIRSDRCEVIYNGVDTRYFADDAVADTRSELRAQLGLSPNDYVVVSVGMLRAEKGQLDLVEALGLMRQSCQGGQGRPKLVLIGDGPKRMEIEGRVGALGLSDDVIFTGTIRDVRPYLKAADVFALGSHSETFSNAALEAAAMGLPLVLSDVEGNRELIEQAGCGLLPTVRSPASFAEELSGLAMDADRRAGFSIKARQAAHGDFSLERMVDAWRRVLWDRRVPD